MFLNGVQKETSKYLKEMWEVDPFKPKWAVLAYAYTAIRDQVGKAHAPLSRFLDLVCPRIGVLGVDVYATQMNWTFELTDTGYVLRQSSQPDFDAFPTSIISTNMTHRDILLLCGELGYIHDAIARYLAQTSQRGLLAPIPNPHFPNRAAMSPVSAATAVLGFDVGSLLESVTPEYPYTQSLDHLDDRSEGHINIDGLISDQVGIEWDTTDIEDPQAFDNMLNGLSSAVADGYLAPNGNVIAFPY